MHPPRPLIPRCLDLFRYSVAGVTPDDVAYYALQDPGYPRCVATFTRIIESSELPGRATFEISEIVDTTMWSEARREVDSLRFRRFRAFTCSVGVAMVAAGTIDESTPANCLVATLVEDARELRDPKLLPLLDLALDELYGIVTVRDDPSEAAFVLLGRLLLAIERGDDETALADLSERLMLEESRSFNRASPAFVWGCTCFDALQRRWKRLVEQMLVPSTDALQFLREALLTDS